MKSFTQLVKELSRHKGQIKHETITFELVMTNRGFELMERSNAMCQYYSVNKKEVRYGKFVTDHDPLEFTQGVLDVLKSKDRLKKLDEMFGNQIPNHPLLSKLKAAFPFSDEKHYVEVYIRYKSRPSSSIVVRFVGSTYGCTLITRTNRNLDYVDSEATELLTVMLEDTIAEKKRLDDIKDISRDLPLPIYEEIETELGYDVDVYDAILSTWGSSSFSNGGL